jgi:hypothetical protein
MLRPTLRHTLRPMVSPNMLDTHNYEIEVVDFSSGSNNENTTDFKNLKKIELHPLEWDGLIVLYNPKKDKEQRIEIPLGNIIDIDENGILQRIQTSSSRGWRIEAIDVSKWY